MELKNALNYPYDFELINRKKKKIERSFDSTDDFKKVKVALLGGATTAELRDRLNLFFLKKSISAEFYESEFNQFYEESLDPSEGLQQFSPDYIYIYNSSLNLRHIGNNELLNEDVETFKSCIQSLKGKFQVPIIVNNFEYLSESPLGNLDRSKLEGNRIYIDEMNTRLGSFIEENNGVYLCDQNYLANWFGLHNWHDKKLWFNFKYASSFEGITLLCENVSNIIQALLGRSKKCLVLDLDNTLWGGVIGDDGVEGIKLGQEDGISESYIEFQKYILSLKKAGIILAINSKNEMESAIEGLNHPQSLLKPEDFVAMRVNWNPKALNIIELAEEINIGLDSMVFIDDNPAEREIVKSQVPQVIVPEVEANPISFIEALDREGYFHTANLSEEDLKRSAYYADNAKRKQQESRFKNYGEYLSSLEMTGKIISGNKLDLNRVTQLINKTNQFNLTVQRYTFDEVSNMNTAADKYLMFSGQLSDKFGDNGIISVVIGKIEDNILHTDLWVMSCRVFKRDFELAMFDYLYENALAKNVEEIRGYYKPGPKNKIVENHYEKLGFEFLEKKGEDSVWSLKINNEIEKKNKYIRVDYE